MKLSADRLSLLNKCLELVAARYNFTDPELNDIKTITNSYSSTNNQTVTDGSAGAPSYPLPVYSYTPYTYQSSLLSSLPSASDYSSPSTSSGTSVSYTLPPNSASTNQELCDEAKKSNYQYQYEAARADLGKRRESELNSYASSHSSLSGSGLYGQQILYINDKYDREISRLKTDLQYQLRSIHCG